MNKKDLLQGNYREVLKLGDKWKQGSYGEPCKHDVIKNGYCTRCFMNMAEIDRRPILKKNIYE